MNAGLCKMIGKHHRIVLGILGKVSFKYVFMTKTQHGRTLCNLRTNVTSVDWASFLRVMATSMACGKLMVESDVKEIMA